jgi:hypothetical protein
MFPHMHLIGRTVNVTAKLPDGTTRPLISIGDWDFNWQHYYQYATPIRLPAGTKIEGCWTYDNSEGNPANPSMPPKRVTFGEQTVDEMAIAILDVLPGETTPGAAGAATKVELRTPAAKLMRRADTDKNEKLSLDELMSVLGDYYSAKELRKRIDQFDRDNDKQLNEVELVEALRSLVQ